MKKFTQLVLSAAAFVPLHGLAQSAASNVQLYGRLDISVNQHHFSGTPTQAEKSVTLMSSDTSLFGFKGSEDLGGGARAYFKIESGFNLDTGMQYSSTTLFNRETYVGIASDRYGAVQLGSQYVPTQWLTKKADPFERSSTGALLTLFQESATNAYGYVAQFNNAVQYISPEVAGVVGRAYWSAGEGSNLGNAWSLGIEYTGSRLWIGATAGGSHTTGAMVGLPGPTATDRSTALGATYALDSFKLHGFLINDSIDGRSRMNGYMAGVSIPFGPGEFHTSYSRRHRLDVNNADSSLLAVNYNYLMSKRTTLYLSASRLDNEAASRFGVWPASREAAALGYPFGGQDVTALQLGIRHLF
ncbi:MAG: porin [Pseudomonadota bacterium]